MASKMLPKIDSIGCCTCRSHKRYKPRLRNFELLGCCWYCIDRRGRFCKWVVLFRRCTCRCCNFDRHWIQKIVQFDRQYCACLYHTVYNLIAQSARCISQYHMDCKRIPHFELEIDQWHMFCKRIAHFHLGRCLVDKSVCKDIFQSCCRRRLGFEC